MDLNKLLKRLNKLEGWSQKPNVDPKMLASIAQDSRKDWQHIASAASLLKIDKDYWNLNPQLQKAIFGAYALGKVGIWIKSDHKEIWISYSTRYGGREQFILYADDVVKNIKQGNILVGDTWRTPADIAKIKARKDKEKELYDDEYD